MSRHWEKIGKRGSASSRVLAYTVSARISGLRMWVLPKPQGAPIIDFNVSWQCDCAEAQGPAVRVSRFVITSIIYEF